MTATLDRASSLGETWTIGAGRLLAGLDRQPTLDLAAHLAALGPMPATDHDRLLTLLDSSALFGRGGAGFPFARKLRAVRGNRPSVVVNGAESEPASQKDRTLLHRAPHLVLDGALAAAGAVGARTVTVAVHDDAAARAVQAAAAERGDAKNIRVRLVSARFVAGEARALVRALDGGPALPPGRHEHATASGHLVSNVETLAQLAVLVRMGGHRFAQTGTPTEPGTTLLTVGGAVSRPGVVEIPIGTPLGILLSAAGAVDPRYVITGGYHGSWLAPDPATPLSRGGLAAVGGTFGAGVLFVLDASTCPLGELTRVAHWLAHQSAKQCGPCRFGLPALAQDVEAIYHGRPGSLATAHRHASAVDGRGACHHPDGASRFITSGIWHLRDEIEQHARGGCGRPVRGLLPVAGPGAVAA